MINVSDLQDTVSSSFVFNHKFNYDGGFGSKITTKAPTTTQTNYQNYNTLGNVLTKTKSSTLAEAKQVATELITNFNGGYVVKRGGELFIADNLDIDSAVHIWRWNINGLGYSSTGINGTYGLAMTMNGQIVADFIKTGILNASLIATGGIAENKINTTSTTNWNTAKNYCR